MNGFDWRAAAAGRRPASDGAPTSCGWALADLAEEIPTRPQPPLRADETTTVAAPRTPKIAAIARWRPGAPAGMALPTSCWLEVNGMPMVLPRGRGRDSVHAKPVVVVTGNEQGKVQATLRGCKATCSNPRFAEGEHVAADRHCCLARQYRRRARLSRRHAPGNGGRSRSPDRGL